MKNKETKTDNRYSYFIEEIGFDYILETRYEPDFLEVISSMGGDISRIRVYGSPDGTFESFKTYEK